MKNLVIFIATVFLLSCSEIRACEHVYLEKGGICHVRVGVVASELRQKYPKNISDTVVIREGEEPALRYKFNKNQSAILELDENGRVWAIRVETPDIKTKAGIGVGSTFEEVMTGYSAAKLRYGLEEGGYLSLVVDDINGLFSFDISKLDHTLLASEELRTDKLNNLKVDLVIIY